MSKDLALNTISENIKKLLVSKANALPKNFNETRFLQNCMLVLNDTKDIEKMDTKSVARTMLKGAFLGLDFFSKECYAIPYGGQLNFQTDYKGEIKLAKKYSINPIKDIYAKLVKEGDLLEVKIVEGRQIVNFYPLNFNDCDIKGAFAIAYFEDGSMLFESMSKKEIETTRKNYSKIPNGPAWEKSLGEMYKKTVLRRLCKLISIDFDNSEQDEAFRDGSDFDESKIKQTIDVIPIKDPFVKDSNIEIKGEKENKEITEWEKEDKEVKSV